VVVQFFLIQHIGLVCAVARSLKEYSQKQKLNKHLPVRLPEPQQTAPVKICVRYAGAGFDQHQPHTRVAIIPAVLKQC
jgi:hypothetical protein